jgi:hypothetical protein
MFFERVTGKRICLGDWNCLTRRYKYSDYFDGTERYKTCPLKDECQTIFLISYERERQELEKYGTIDRKKKAHATV